MKDLIYHTAKKGELNKKLMKMCQWGDPGPVRKLIEEGADITYTDKNGWTPLHNAAWGRDQEVCELLIQNGADITLKNKDGNTPYDIAKKQGHKRLVEILKPYYKSHIAKKVKDKLNDIEI
jgi:ankyrin repeat protein